MKFSVQRRRFVAASVAGTLALGLGVAATPVAAAADAPANRTAIMTGERHQGLPGQYQTAYSAKTNRMYLSAVDWAGKADDGTLINGASTIAEVDPVTLKVLHAAPVPAEKLSATDAADYGLTEAYEPVQPFGIVADDFRNLVWSTDTTNNTVSAYDQATLEPVWRSPVGSVSHGREVSVMPNGDVIASGSNGLFRITGSRQGFTIAPYALNNKEAGIAMSMVPVNGEVFVNGSGAPKIFVLDEATGAVKRTFDVTPESAGVSHGNLAVDNALGVVVAVDQGKRGATGYVGSGVNFYKTDGTVLGHIAAGAHNLSVAVDQANHIAYVGDMGGNGEVRAFDLNAAAAGKPAQIGEIATTTVPKGGFGVNHLTMVKDRVFVANKDAAYAGVTVPYGVNLKDGKPVAVKDDADSILLLKSDVSNKTFDAATDKKTASNTAGYDLSKLVVGPLPVDNGPLGIGSSNLGSGSLDAGSSAGAVGGQLNLGSLGSLAGN